MVVRWLVPRKTLEHVGFDINEYVQVTDLGIEKNHDFNIDLSDIGKVTDHLASRISKREECSNI